MEADLLDSFQQLDHAQRVTDAKEREEISSDGRLDEKEFKNPKLVVSRVRLSLDRFLRANKETEHE